MASKLAKTSTGIGRGNTNIYQDNGHYAVTLHQTVIFDETRDTVTLDNGGWITPTTARRMNQVLEHRGFVAGVRIKNGEMFYGDVAFVNNKAVISKGA